MVLSMEKWKGKVAVVTGASVGIGAAIAESLVSNGVTVVGLARRVELIEKLAKKLTGKSGTLHALKVDLSNTEQIVEVFKTIEKKFGAIHILINNAGLLQNNSLSDGDVDKWRKVLDVNVIGVCTTAREAITSMKKHDVNGYIININSYVGHFVPRIHGMNIYPASKFAVTALTETLKLELLKEGRKIRVSTVSPGVVATEFSDAGDLDMHALDGQDVLKPDDIVDAVTYVLSTPPHVQVQDVLILPMSAQY